MTPDEAAHVFVTPTAYAEPGRFHRATAVLRRDAPIHRVEAPGYPAFWAVARHSDVLEISTHSDTWKNRPRASLKRSELTDRREADLGGGVQTLIHLDDPRHRELRGVTVEWFSPRGLARLERPIAALAKDAVDRMAALGGSCDFAVDIAMPFPLRVIMSLLGFPDAEFDRMLGCTQEIFAPDDPEMTRGSSPEASAPPVLDLFAYFGEVLADRQANPREDLATVIATATPPGEPISLMEQLSYLGVIATAGHDTTSAALSGGVQALIEHPDQLARLRADPALLPSATEEILRWTSPVKHMLRTAATSNEVGGQLFEPGDRVLLSYWSANHDESVFEDPHRFDITRTPNRHLAFGFGAHYCLGASLARVEIKAFFAELLPRLESIDLAGEPKLTEAIFVSGLKHLPITYRLV